MENIKSIIAKNITQLRHDRGFTQLELAEKLNYSDKAVSKWERAESLPDISVLVDIADLFEVPLDYLVRAEHPQEVLKSGEKDAHPYRKICISAVSILLVWFIAVFIFVLVTIFAENMRYRWLIMIYALPISIIVWLVFNSIWFRPRRNYMIVSLLMWSVLLTVRATLVPFGIYSRAMYLLGIPGQGIIVFWSFMKKPSRQLAPEGNL